MKYEKKLLEEELTKPNSFCWNKYVPLFESVTEHYGSFETLVLDKLNLDSIILATPRMVPVFAFCSTFKADKSNLSSNGIYLCGKLNNTPIYINPLDQFCDCFILNKDYATRIFVIDSVEQLDE